MVAYHVATISISVTKGDLNNTGYCHEVFWGFYNIVQYLSVKDITYLKVPVQNMDYRL